jgi:O-6-methylguanine DNA methyltransferase
MEILYYNNFDSPIGELWGACSGKGLVRFGIHTSKDEFITDLKNNFKADIIYSPENLMDLKTQLKEYFEGKRHNFVVKFDLRGTEFQRKVWEAIFKIPYGCLNSYGRIAKEIGKPKAYRAAANAVGDNPLGLIIPCHRVVESNGGFGGFGGDLPLKRKILKHEGIFKIDEGTPEKGVDLRSFFYY